jgi:1-phosphatidylinositol-4-phosphate 5-kinase
VRKVSKGLNRFKEEKKLHFVVMGNMFNTPFEIHRRYDLKGSWVGRVTPGKHLLDPSIALKDVDFKQAGECIHVGQAIKDQLIKQIESDSAFLRDNNVIDYSMLVGFHDIGTRANGAEDCNDDAEDGKATVQIRDIQNPQGTGYVSMATLARSNTNVTNATVVTFPASPSSIQPPAGAGGLAAEAPLHQRDLGGLLSSDRTQLYSFGIIDILTPYDTAKRMEHHFKALRHDRRGVSCCPPVFYAERFNDFMRMAFR